VSIPVVELSGGVGGARLARGLAALDGLDLTIVVNVGDDAPIHGLQVSPDLDTVIYTLAQVEGPQGWGRADDTFAANTELARFGVDNSFRLGDMDLALKIYRTGRLATGSTLSDVTDSVSQAFGLDMKVLPASNDPVRTMVTIVGGHRLSFREYFVDRGHRDHVERLDFEGAETALPAPGVVERIDAAELLVIGPSNPPLSIWPMLAIDEIGAAVRRHPHVVAISPLIGGQALKGPAEVVMSDLGLGTGTDGVLAAYEGMIDTLVVDTADRADIGERAGVQVIALDIRISEPGPATDLARAILAL
jgi:LPPG:FO 2-phospho-L-lactate transferase